METLSNLASTASKVVFGESAPQQQQSGEEPLSGKTGAGTVDEPYDEGNADEATQQQMQKSGEEPVSGETGAGTVDEPYDEGNADEATQQQMQKSSEEPLSGDNGKGTAEQSTTFDTGMTGAAEQSSIEASNLPSKPETASSTAPTSAVQNDSVTSVGDPTSAQITSEEHQGAGRPAAEPSSTQTEAVKREKAETEEVVGASDGTRDPTEQSGEPLAIRAKEQVSGDVSNSEGTTSTEMGTDENYVKSTGTAAEGGDFDATKPGAGKEADRLLEQKGIERDSAPGTMDTPAAQDTESPGKVSKMARFKEKLHIGKK